MQLPKHMPFGDVDKRIGKRLRMLREDKKLSTKDFAKLIGVRETCLVQCELGKQRIAPTLMMHLSAVFGLQNQYFFMDNEVDRPHANSLPRASTDAATAQ